MRVRLKTLYAGPTGIFQPGALVTFTDSEANDLIAGGYASPEFPTKPRVEAAILASVPEVAQIERAPDLVAPRNTNRAPRPAKRLSP